MVFPSSQDLPELEAPGRVRQIHPAWMSALATEDMSAVETGPMSAAKTGQMSAVGARQMFAAEKGPMSAVETRQMSTIATGRCPVLILCICLVSTADICPVSTADISISIDHSASAVRINNRHIMEAATAADLTQASEIAGRYITLGIAAKGYVLDLTVCTGSPQ